MNSQTAIKKNSNNQTRNPLEIDSNQSKGNRSLLDSVLGMNYPSEQDRRPLSRREYPSQKRQSESVTVFHGNVDSEQRVIPQQIQELRARIDQQLDILKNKNSEFVTEINRIEKETMQSFPDKPGIYHIRFLELILSYLQDLTAKVGEAKTWMAAMRTKKAKRGSLFGARSKNQGTQYSLSQELQSSRSVM